MICQFISCASHKDLGNIGNFCLYFCMRREKIQMTKSPARPPVTFGVQWRCPWFAASFPANINRTSKKSYDAKWEMKVDRFLLLTGTCQNKMLPYLSWKHNMPGLRRKNQKTSEIWVAKVKIFETILQHAFTGISKKMWSLDRTPSVGSAGCAAGLPFSHPGEALKQEAMLAKLVFPNETFKTSENASSNTFSLLSQISFAIPGYASSISSSIANNWVTNCLPFSLAGNFLLWMGHNWNEIA